MASDLEKIDIIRARTGVSYNEAKQALDDAGGDVVQAIINMEEGNSHCCGKMRGTREEMFKRVKGLWNQGQETKIKVKKDDRTVFEVPATVGALGLVGVAVSSELALLGALGGVVAMTRKYSLEIDKDGNVGQDEDAKDNTQFDPRNIG